MDDIYLIIEPQETNIYLVLENSISGGGLFSSDIVMGEIPNGLINGGNATFTSQFPFIPEKIIVERNGVTQRKNTDYSTTGNNTINLTFNPETGESILINYIKL